MPADPPSSPALRASDSDRDRVIELLRAAVADAVPVDGAHGSGVGPNRQRAERQFTLAGGCPACHPRQLSARVDRIIVAM